MYTHRHASTSVAYGKILAIWRESKTGDGLRRPDILGEYGPRNEPWCNSLGDGLRACGGHVRFVGGESRRCGSLTVRYQVGKMYQVKVVLSLQILFKFRFSVVGSGGVLRDSNLSNGVSKIPDFPNES